MNPQQRRKARKLLVQALYSQELSQNSFSSIKDWVFLNNQHVKFDSEYFAEIFDNMAGNLPQLDELVSPFLSRPLEDVNPVELSILRLACYELTYRLDIPYRVVINEALELAKIFGATDGYKFVNGVLDKLAQQVRLEETVA